MFFFIFLLILAYFLMMFSDMFLIRFIVFFVFLDICLSVWGVSFGCFLVYVFPLFAAFLTSFLWSGMGACCGTDAQMGVILRAPDPS